MFRWPKCFRFPASFKKSLGNKTPNHTIFAQHLQTPVQSWLTVHSPDVLSSPHAASFDAIPCVQQWSAHPNSPLISGRKHVCVPCQARAALHESAFSVSRRWWQEITAHTMWRRQISFFSLLENELAQAALWPPTKKNQWINHSTPGGKLAGNFGPTSSCPSGIYLSLNCSRAFNFPLFHIRWIQSHLHLDPSVIQSSFVFSIQFRNPLPTVLQSNVSKEESAKDNLSLWKSAISVLFWFGFFNLEKPS